MARVTLNPALTSLTGEMGGLVFKKRYGRMYVARRPDNSSREPSKAQKDRRQRFRKATAYARMIMADPDARQPYDLAAKEKQTLVQNVIIGDFLTPPSVDQINLDGYYGRPGDTIRITANDDFDVTGVTVTISDGGGQTLEQGRAALSSMRWGKWVYAATTAIAPGTHVRVEAVATDTPGNTGTKSEEMVV